MRAAAIVVLLMALTSFDARAQSATGLAPHEQAERWLYLIQWVGGLSATGYVWSHACQRGDPEVWRRAVAATDQFYQRCVPARSAVARIVESKYAFELLAATNRSKREVGSLAFERALSRGSDAFNKADRTEVCATPKMRRWLESGYVDPKDNWEWFDQALPYRWGSDPSQVEQLPCNDLAAQKDPE